MALRFERSASLWNPWREFRRSKALKRILWLLSGGAVGAVVAFGASLALAEIPGPDGTIHGCVGKLLGNLRVVDSNAQCLNSEITLNWNQTGAPGPAGPAGPAGPVGPVGPAGPAGTAGVSNHEIIFASGDLPLNGDVDVTAACPGEKKVLGGGYIVPSVLDTAPLSAPEGGGGAWRVSFHSNGGSGVAQVYAICATVN
jgi:hypothetical protein